MQLRVIAEEPAGAAWNMAVDEALLQLAAIPTLRLYGFWPHAVSLGYFQRLADFADVPPHTPIVRRLTGGGAIFHGDELTFSLAIDAALLPRDIAASYRTLHDAALHALAAVGCVDSRLLTTGTPPAARPQERWCFAAPGRDDVITTQGKLLGSAQRRVRAPHARVLHHGSLVLERPTMTPFVAAVADSVATTPTMRLRLRELLAHHISQALQLQPAPGALSDDERQLAQQLVSERYANAAFLRRC